MGEVYSEFVEWCKVLFYYYEMLEVIVVYVFFENGKELVV